MHDLSGQTLIVEARDLDTDERTVTTLEVEMPGDEAAQRAQLSAAVARLHPQARMRSFGGRAASFLDAQRLVVARYAGTGEPPVAAGAPVPAEPVEREPPAQQRLFAS